MAKDVFDKEFRKPYILNSGGYQEMMRTAWDKSVWNTFLEVDPIWAEFLFVRSEIPPQSTAAEQRRLRYLKQSEFKKPYGDSGDYPELEYIWTGPIPGIDPWWNFDFPTFPDFPWIDPNMGNEDDPDTYVWVCDADCSGSCCYCPDQEVEISATATYPIVGVESVFDEGELVSISTGIGTNSVTIKINSPAGRSGQMIIKIWMVLPNGTECDSTFNIYECAKDECCNCDIFEWDETSDETCIPVCTADVAVKNGHAPYEWVLTDEDGKWSLGAATTEVRTNTVSAAAGACGSATITVTDACGCEVVFGVRNPSNGTWGNVQAGTCLFKGPQTEGKVGSGTYERITNKWKQSQGYTCGGVSSTGGCRADWDCTGGGCANYATDPVCVSGFVCASPRDDQQTSAGCCSICCNRDCSHVGKPGEYARERQCCGTSNVGAVREWIC